MQLAAISGVNGVFTDEDFAPVRRLALAARSEALGEVGGGGDGGEAAGGEGEVAVAAGSGRQDRHAGQGDGRARARRF